MPGTHDQIRRLVDRAEECRVLAGIVADKRASASYLILADNYEQLAEEERRLFALRQAKPSVRSEADADIG